MSCLIKQLKPNLINGGNNMQTVFSRNEKKYQLTLTQASQLIDSLAKNMKSDEYGTYWVQNLYYDTDNWDIINTSMEKPLYKEKMRMRCYGTPETTDRIFLELKKKYAGVVYKRRVAIAPSDIAKYDINKILANDNSQIAKELAYHIQQNDVAEKFFLSYHRQAFAGIAGKDDGLRITIDSDISYRLDKLYFAQPTMGCYELNPNIFLLEIKTPLGIPLWLTRLLCELEIYATSFSKYAACFTDWSQQVKQGKEKTKKLVTMSA